MDLGLCSKIKHKIETNEQGPIIIPPRRTPIATEEKVEKHIQDLLKKQYNSEKWLTLERPFSCDPKT